MVGDLLPLAVASPSPPSRSSRSASCCSRPRAGAASAAFGLGLTVSVVAVTVAAAALAGGADLGSDDDPSAAASVTELVLGGLLLLVAARQWRSRPRGDEPAALPSWMAAVDQVTPVQAAGFGVHHSVVNPKNRRLRVWAGARLRGPLDELKGWLQANNATVMAVLLLVLGAACWGRDSVDCSDHPLRVRERHAGGATVSRRGPVRHPRRR